MNAPHAKQPAASLESPRSTARPISAFGRPPSLHHPRAPTRDFHPPETHARIRRHLHTETQERKRNRKRKSEKEREGEKIGIHSIHSKSEEGWKYKRRRFRKYATHHVQVCPVPLPFLRCIMARVEWRVTDTYGVVHVSVT